MRKDPTKFRERFQRWKQGLPAYKDGKPVEDEGQDKSVLSKIKNNFHDKVNLVLNTIRDRSYRKIMPTTDYNIKENAKAFFMEDDIDYGANDGDVHFLVDAKSGKHFLDDGTIYDMDVVDDIWAKYLNIPEDKRRFNFRLLQSSYTPTMGANKNEQYYKLPLTDDDKGLLIEETNNLPINKNKVSDILEHYNVANHTVGRGFDSKGEYRSYYDRWDINPFNGKYHGIKIPILNNLDDVTFGIGNPVNIYDRIYLDDYYGVPNPTNATYLPEVMVTPNSSGKTEHRFLRTLKNLGISEKDSPQVEPKYNTTK